MAPQKATNLLNIAKLASPWVAAATFAFSVTTYIGKEFGRMYELIYTIKANKMNVERNTGEIMQLQSEMRLYADKMHNFEVWQASTDKTLFYYEKHRLTTK